MEKLTAAQMTVAERTITPAPKPTRGTRRIAPSAEVQALRETIATTTDADESLAAAAAIGTALREAAEAEERARFVVDNFDAAQQTPADEPIGTLVTPQDAAAALDADPAPQAVRKPAQPAKTYPVKVVTPPVSTKPEKPTPAPKAPSKLDVGNTAREVRAQVKASGLNFIDHEAVVAHFTPLGTIFSNVPPVEGTCGCVCVGFQDSSLIFMYTGKSAKSPEATTANSNNRMFTLTANNNPTWQP